MVSHTDPLDAPRPPGGPQRTDERDPDQSEASTDEHPLQMENAETSLDQPSQ